RVAALQQVSVLVLTVETPAEPLSRALAAVATGSARVVVIDCIDIDALGAEARDEIVAFAANLRTSGGHVIVVNAPEPEVRLLRAHGLDVAATTDRGFVDDPGQHPDREALHQAFPG